MGLFAQFLFLFVVLPAVVVVGCFTGVLPKPLLTSFATFRHWLQKKGKFTPKNKRKFDYSPITDKIYVGRQPRSMDDIKMLQEKEGISAIVCLNEDYELYVTQNDIAKSGLSVERLHIPVPDYQGASLEELSQAVKFIDKMLSQERKVFIHCNGGRGRSAGLAAAYLLYKNEAEFQDFHDAVKYVRKRRPVTSSGLDRFPISSASRSLFAYDAHLKQKGKNRMFKHLKDYLNRTIAVPTNVLRSNM